MLAFFDQVKIRLISQLLLLLLLLLLLILILILLLILLLLLLILFRKINIFKEKAFINKTIINMK